MKRGESGLSLLVAVDKPCGLSSHDVVNRCRRVFGERRVGHTGTLDPLASGVLPVCIGPATRLDAYMVGHDKRYRVAMRFGFETNTDDGEGEPTVRGQIASQLFEEEFARKAVERLVGEHEQVPPLYSAIKVNGQRAYKLARGGGDVRLDARTIRVLEADFLGLSEDDEGLTWEYDVLVTKGTYIRSLVRDLGRTLGCPAHLAGLRRLQAGAVSLADCVELETLARRGADAALDPVAVLGFRFACADGCAKAVGSGMRLREERIELYEPVAALRGRRLRTSGQRVSERPAEPDERICLVLDGRLKAIYRFDGDCGQWVAECVFSVPVARC